MSHQNLLLMLIGCLVGVTSNRVPRLSPAGNGDCPPGCAFRRDHVVDCAYAGLEAVPRVPPTTRRLILDGNGIAEIRGEDFSRMTHLEELYLHANRIENMTDDETLWRFLLGLRLLDLSHNPLRCDCNLKSEFETPRGLGATPSLRVLNLEGTACSFPGQVGGRAVRVINSAAPDCRRRERRHPSQATFCSREPCLNGGTCHEQVRMSGGAGWCSCPLGFDGEFCEWHKGEELSVRVGEVSSHRITVHWSIAARVMDFRVRSVEDPDGAGPVEEREWVDGTCTWHELSDLRPATVYEVCVAAYGFGVYGPNARSPGNLIEEVCLRQKTDPVPTTTEDSPDGKTQQQPTSSIGSDDGNQDQTKLVMMIFGVILSICVLLILAVLALYVSRRRGFTLLPRRGRRRRRRRSPPNVAQVDSPTYGSTDSPTPSEHDVPAGAGARPAPDTGIPLILVTSASNEEFVNPDDDNRTGLNGASECGEPLQSYANAPGAKLAHAQSGGADSAGQLPQREDGDGVSSHEGDFETSHVVTHKSEPHRPEKEVIQC